MKARNATMAVKARKVRKRKFVKKPHMDRGYYRNVHPPLDLFFFAGLSASISSFGIAWGPYIAWGWSGWGHRNTPFFPRDATLTQT